MEDAVRELVAATGCQTANSTKAGRFARNKTVQNVEAWQEGYRPIALFIMERQWMLEAALCGFCCWRGGNGAKVRFIVLCSLMRRSCALLGVSDEVSELAAVTGGGYALPTYLPLAASFLGRC